MSLNIKNTSNAYGLLSIGFHWLTALLILTLYPLGLYLGTLSYYDEGYQTFPHWHQSLGLILFFLYLGRLSWNLYTASPKPLATKKVIKLTAKAMHSFLYLILLITLISGYLISSADGEPIAIFNWLEISPLVNAIEQQEDRAGTLHFYAATGLITCSLLHASMALKHHFINRDNTLKRMLGTIQTKENNHEKH